MYAIGYEDERFAEQAKAIAEQFNLVIENDYLPRLSFVEERLVLLTEQFKPLFVDFSAKTLQKRRDEGKHQGLVKACKPGPNLTILDLTAGWGRDAAVLASFGAKLTMLERHPMMAALLHDALQYKSPTISLGLIYQDASDYLNSLNPSDYPEVIYIDPMHPSRQKSALVKKDMQALQQLLDPDDGVSELLQLAITRVKQRVVVKWPQSLAALIKPDYCVPGKTVRFDCYSKKT